MAKSKYRLRNLVHQYKRKGPRILNYYSAPELAKMHLKVEDTLNTVYKIKNKNGKAIYAGTAFAIANKKELKELKHHLEIKILEKTVLTK